MNLSDIIEQFKDRAKVIWHKVQESSAYQQAMEKYEDLPATQQKLIRVGGGLLLILFVLSPPISTLLSSQETIQEFERKREVTRDLLRVVRDSANVPNIPQAPDLFSLQNRFQREFQNDKLLPEQIYSIQANSESGLIIPKNLSLGSLSVQLRDLNLRQILDIAYRLATISPTVKMTELEMTASAEKAGYFHLTSKVVALKAPEPPKIEAEEPKGKQKPPRKSKTEDEE